LIEREDKKVLISNFVSLSFLQGANYVLPLLTFPYILQTIGVENFGLLAMATALIAYLNIFTDYGFNLTAVNTVSINKNNINKLIEIFSSIFSIKFILLSISFCILLGLIAIFDNLRENWEIFLLTFGLVIGNMLFPIWLFQGLQKMKYITYINIFTKILFTISIFIFINKPEDILLIPLFHSLGSILSGIVALIYIKKDFNITFKFQSLATLKIYVLDGWHIFKTYIFVSLYTNSNIIILGFLTNNTIVGYYAVADKIINAVGGLFTPLNQTLYPYLSSLYVKSISTFKNLYYKIIFIYITASIILFILLSIFKNNIIFFINGSYNNTIGMIYTILTLLIFTFPFGAFFALIMNILALKKEISTIIMRASIINILFAPLLVYIFSATGMAIVSVFIQYYIMISYYKNIKVGYGRNQ